MTNAPVDIVTDIAQLDNFDADDNLVESGLLQTLLI